MKPEFLIEKNGRRMVLYAAEPPAWGWCQCGCGERTSIATRNEYRRGHVKGKPIGYLPRHSRSNTYPALIEVPGPLPTPCWVWQRGLTSEGYGQTSIGGVGWLVHRFVYEAVKGPIPPGRELDHLCRVRCCANPDHLEPVSHAVNTRRGDAAILTAELVGVIRTTKVLRPAQLARAFGVSPQTICDIQKGRKWVAA
jgi:HNH endonuclease